MLAFGIGEIQLPGRIEGQNSQEGDASEGWVILWSILSIFLKVKNHQSALGGENLSPCTLHNWKLISSKSEPH